MILPHFRRDGDGKREKPKSYRVLTGLNFGTERAEPGDVRDDIPEQSVAWLLKRGAIEEVDE